MEAMSRVSFSTKLPDAKFRLKLGAPRSARLSPPANAIDDYCAPEESIRSTGWVEPLQYHCAGQKVVFALHLGSDLVWVREHRYEASRIGFS